MTLTYVNTANRITYKCPLAHVQPFVVDSQRAYASHKPPLHASTSTNQRCVAVTTEVQVLTERDPAEHTLVANNGINSPLTPVFHGAYFIHGQKNTCRLTFLLNKLVTDERVILHLYFANKTVTQQT